MASKKKKVAIECDQCQTSAKIEFSKKGSSVQCCPFCGEEVDIIQPEDRPLLNNFDDLDEFDESEYYGDEDAEE